MVVWGSFTKEWKLEVKLVFYFHCFTELCLYTNKEPKQKVIDWWKAQFLFYLNFLKFSLPHEVKGYMNYQTSVLVSLEMCSTRGSGPMGGVGGAGGRLGWA